MLSSAENMEKNTGRVIIRAFTVMLIVLSVMCVCGLAGVSAFASETGGGAQAVQEEKYFYFEKKAFSVYVGDKMRLPLKASPEHGKITYKSSKPAVIYVNSKGTVTAKAKGSATITAMLKNGQSVKCVVRAAFPKTKIVMSDASIKVDVGQTKTIGFSIQPDDGAERTVTWSSSDTSVAAVEDGVITGKAKGTAVITAASKNCQEAKCTVEVEVPAKRVTVKERTVRLTVGDEYIINAAVLPADASDKSLTYRVSNSKAVSVDSSGKLKALSRGASYVRVLTANNKSVLMTFKVYDPIRSVIIPKSITLGCGETAAVSAKFRPYYVKDSTLSWESSDPDVAVVENGTIKTFAQGEAVITAAAYNGVSAECRVTVKKEPASLRLMPQVSSMGIGEKVTLSAVIPDGSYAGKIVYSSSAPDVCSVSAKGVVTALGEGTAIISCHLYNGLTDMIRIKVKAAPTSISLEPGTLRLAAGESGRLVCRLNDGQASYRRRFLSSNKNVVDVDRNGNYIAVAPGRARIYASVFNGKKTSCVVTVIPKPVSVSFDKESLEMLTGDEAQLNAVLSEGADVLLSFTSDNPNICSIDQNGRVSALSEGETTLRVVTQNGEEGRCKVTVKKSASWIGFYLDKKVLYPGQTYNLKYYLPPYEYTHGVVFSSDNESVCTVGDDGCITAVGVGEATVKATAHNGCYAGCSVTVTYDEELIAKDPDNLPPLEKTFKAVLQYPELPTGCEITSLTMVLNHLGFDVTKVKMASDYMKKGLAWETDFREAFAGNPFSEYSYGCYAPVIVDAANKFLEEQGSDLRAVDLSGFSFDDLLNFTDNGVPVMVWTTIGLIPGFYTATWTADNGETVTWYANEHCMVLVGHNDESSSIFAADPDKGKIVEYDRELFKTRFHELFEQAVVIFRK